MKEEITFSSVPRVENASSYFFAFSLYLSFPSLPRKYANGVAICAGMQPWPICVDMQPNPGNNTKLIALLIADVLTKLLLAAAPRFWTQSNNEHISVFWSDGNILISF